MDLYVTRQYWSRLEHTQAVTIWSKDKTELTINNNNDKLRINAPFCNENITKNFWAQPAPDGAEEFVEQIDLRPYFAPFPRHSNLLAENAIFYTIL